MFLLRFPCNAAQKAALARISLFLEDAALRGTVVPALPSGRVGGAAAYTGHNMRSADLARFFSLARRAGSPLPCATGCCSCSSHRLAGSHAVAGGPRDPSIFPTRPATPPPPSAATAARPCSRKRRRCWSCSPATACCARRPPASPPRRGRASWRWRAALSRPRRERRCCTKPCTASSTAARRVRERALPLRLRAA